MAARYSARSLADKLGGVTLHTRLSTSSGFIHWFVTARGELAGQVGRLARALSDQGMLWVSWPKQSSGVKTDLNQNIIRSLGLKEGLVDVGDKCF